METTTNDLYPFIGLSAYTEERAESFFGRREEINVLLKRINSNIVTVITGKSGIGKTSLIKAGLLPALRREYLFPIYIRINFKNKRATPTRQIKKKIVNRLRKVDENIPEFKGRTLWEYFHQVKLMDGLLKPVLIFDQFEDIFYLEKKNQKEANEVIMEISNLGENQIPVSVSAKYGKETIPFSYKKQNYRIVLSIRESAIPLLDDFTSFIPSVSGNKFKLPELNRQAAIEVVYNSAKQITTLETAEKIVDMILVESIPDFSKHSEDKELINSFLIEPFIVSLVCFEINEIRLAESINELNDILLEKVKIQKIVKEFYEHSTSDLPKALREIIENQLLTFDGYRKLQSKSELILKEEVEEEDINRLINRRIVRNEIWNGSEHIEIIHDILVPVVKSIRDKRIEEERRAKREEELKEIRRREEQKRLSEKRKMQKEAEVAKKKHRRKVKTYTFLTIIAVIVAGIMAILWIYAEKQSDIAEISAKEASSNYVAADGLLIADKNPTKGFQLAKSAYEQSPHNKMSIRAIIKCFYEGNFYSNFLKLDGSGIFAHYFPDKAQVAVSVNDSFFIYKNNGELIRKFKSKGKVNWFEISNNGKFIVAAYRKNAYLYSVTGEELQIFSGHKRSIHYVTFSPDSKQIATASKDNSVIIWDLSGNKLLSIEGSKNDINTVDFSPDGNYILTAGQNRELTIRNMKGRMVFKDSLDNAITLAKYSPYGNYIVSATTGPSLNIHSRHGYKITSKNLVSKVNYINFSYSGKYFVSANDNGVAAIWDSALVKYSEFKGHESPIVTADFSPDMRKLITTGVDNTIKKWGLRKPEPYKIVETDRPLFFVEVNSKNQILSAIKDTIILWDKQGNLINKFSHGDRVYSVRFSKKEDKIISSGNDTLTKVWDLKGNLIKQFRGHTNDIMSAHFSNNDKQVITAGRDDYVFVWSMDGKKLDEFKVEEEQVIWDMDISPDNNYIAISTQSNDIIIWNRKTNKSISVKAVHERAVNSISFSPKGDKILTSGGDKTAKIWSLEGKLLENLKGHTDVINTAEFSPDGKYVITSSKDNTVRFWSVDGEELFISELHKAEVHAAVFSKSGKYIISASSDKTIKRWPIACSEIIRYIDKFKIYGKVWQLDPETKEKYDFIF